MPRHEWRDIDRRRRGFGPRHRDDFGQADYSREYAYDPDTRSGYRADEDASYRDDDFRRADEPRDWDYDERPRAERHDEDDRYDRAVGRREEPRSWMDRAGELFAGRRDEDDERRTREEYETERRARQRRGPSDRVLWAVIVERLEDERGLDLRDLEVLVEDAEVTLNGTVRRKEDKRRIEDVADIQGVRNVQNNLRVRERPHWSFL